MSIRLNKAIRELNIGIQTAAEFLTKNYGLEGADNPNLKLTDEQYDGLKKAYAKDAAMRSQAEKLTQKVKAKKPSIDIETADKAAKAANTGTREKEEKTETTVAEQPARQQYKPIGKIDLDQLNRPRKAAKAENETPQQEPVKTEKPVEEKATENVKETVTPEKLETKAEETPSKAPEVKAPAIQEEPEVTVEKTTETKAGETRWPTFSRMSAP